MYGRVPPEADTEMLPLLLPQEGWVKRVDICMPEDAPTVAETVLEHAPVPDEVTVTVYVPAATDIGFEPLSPPVQLYVYGAVPPATERLILPLLRPQLVATVMGATVRPVVVLITAEDVPVQPVDVWVTVTV